jgi:prolyl oligopeptidase
MAALLQAASSSGRPILLHYNISDSHSAAGLEQWIGDDADELAFLWTETGLTSSSASHAP